MKISYYRERKEHHMVVAAGKHLCAKYQMNMVTQNPIAGLIAPDVRLMNGEILYDYAITGCQSLQTLTELAPIGRELLVLLVETLDKVLEEVERYLVDGDYLALRPEFIYVEMENEVPVRVKYCFFPFYAQAVEDQMREVLKYVLNEVDYQNKAAVNLAYELFQQASQEDFLIRQLMQIVEDAQEKGKEMDVQREEPSDRKDSEVEERSFAEVSPGGWTELLPEKRWDSVKKKKGLFGGRIGKRERETVLSDILK